MTHMSKISKLMVACAATALLAPAAAGGEHVVILSTNDTHSQIDPASDGLGGILRRRAVFDQVRRDNKHVVAVDAGDDVQGTLYFSLYGGKVEFACLDSLHYDMTIMGNHELDNGADSLAFLYNKMLTPRLSTNYDMSASRMAGHFEPYIVKAFGDKRMAFIGLNVNPKGMISEGNYNGIRYLDPYDVADATAKYLKEVQKVDFVTVVSHIGYDSYEASQPNDSTLVTRSHYIDLVIGGHSHTLLRPGDKRTQVANADGRIITIGQNGKSGKYVGRYDVDLDTRKVEYSQIKIDSSLDAAAARYTAMQAWLAPYRHGVDSLMNTPVVTSARRMASQSQAAQNWLSDAAASIVRGLSGRHIDFAVMNKGGIRQDFPQGDMSEGLIGSMFPFNNRFMVLEITGADLLEGFKVMAGRGGDAVSRELRVTYDAAGNVTSAKVNGKKVDPRKVYSMATIDYLANGGDYMVPFTRAKRVYVDGVPYGRHMIAYMRQLAAQGKKVEATGEMRMQKK